MVSSYYDFSSAFNQAVDYKSNSFHVPSTVSNRRLLEFFFKHRYIFFFYPSSTFKNKIIVFPNHTAIDFRLANVSLPSRKFVSTSRSTQSILNSGIRYVVQTRHGVEFSNFFYVKSKHKCLLIFKLILFL